MPTNKCLCPKGRLAASVAVFLLPPVAMADAELSRSIDKVFADVGNDEPGCAAGVIHEGVYIHKAG